MRHLITINDKNYTVGINKRQEIYDIIDEYMGNEFAKYVDEYIGELEEKTNEKYWKTHTDEQTYEEELNEMCSLLDELYGCFNRIKQLAIDRYKTMPEWGYIAENAMKLIERNR